MIAAGFACDRTHFHKNSVKMVVFVEFRVVVGVPVHVHVRFCVGWGCVCGLFGECLGHLPLVCWVFVGFGSCSAGICRVWILFGRCLLGLAGVRVGRR